MCIRRYESCCQRAHLELIKNFQLRFFKHSCGEVPKTLIKKDLMWNNAPSSRFSVMYRTYVVLIYVVSFVTDF